MRRRADSKIVKLSTGLFFVARPILTIKRFLSSPCVAYIILHAFYPTSSSGLPGLFHSITFPLSDLITHSLSLSLSLSLVVNTSIFSLFLMKFARTFIFSQQSIYDEYRNSIERDCRITAPHDCCSSIKRLPTMFYLFKSIIYFEEFNILNK